MWSMFMPDENYFASHITMVLLLVSNNLYTELQETNQNLKIDKDSKDFIYQVCSKYLGTNKEGDYANNVEKVWKKIQNTYTALYNWYKNPLLCIL